MRDLGDTSKIAWVTGPVAPTLPAVPICRAKGGVLLKFTLLSGEWIAIRVHNIDRRDTPCLGDQCPYFWKGYHRSTLLKWYTDGFSWQTRRLCLVEVTEGAMQSFLMPDGSLVPFRRGQAVQLRRIRPENHAPAALDVLPAETAPGTLPPSFDVRGALLRNWCGGNMPG